MPQRPDRDKHVIVRKHDVQMIMRQHFDIVKNYEEKVKYDFGSILHPPYDVSFILYLLPLFGAYTILYSLNIY